jgi:hypothetical protein
MRWSKTSSGKLEEAADAIKYGHYTCPICNAPTVLKRGRKIPPYFAHRRGVGTEECENYHPQFGMHIVPPTPNRESQQQEKFLAPKLTLRVKESNGFLGFVLVYHLPKPKRSSGKIAVDLGFGEKKIIKLHTGSEPYRPFKVEIGQTFYGVMWSSPEVDRNYAKVVKGYLPGPKEKQITAFRSGSGELAQELVPNQTYFFLYNTNYIELTDKLTSSLGHGQLGSWSVLKFTIDEDLDETLMNELAELSELPFAPSKVEIIPLDKDVLWGQSFRQVNLESNRKMLFFAQKNESFLETTTEIQLFDGTNNADYLLEGEAFFEMETNLPSKNERSTVSFEHSGFVARLGRRRTAIKAPPEAKFFSLDGSEASLASERSVEFLNRMLDGHTDTTLSVPQLFQIGISIRETEDWVPYEIDLEMGEPCLRVSGNRTIIFDPVLSILRKKGSFVQVQLDGRGLGCISTLANQSKAAEASNFSREKARLVRIYGRLLYSTAPALVHILFSEFASIKDVRYAVRQFERMYPNHPHIHQIQRLM